MKTFVFLIFVFIKSLLLSQGPSVTITIVQGENRITINEMDTLIVLKQTKFHFEIELVNVEGVYVQASRTSEYYDTPKDSLLRDWIVIPDKVMAEDDFNIDQDLLIDSEGFSYWFYNPKKDWHRFDNEISVIKNRVKATYTVTKFFDTDLQKAIALSDYLDTIFLLFFIAEENDTHQLTQEISRKIIRIRFQ
jgi:hypothetical protein